MAPAARPASHFRNPAGVAAPKVSEITSKENRWIKVFRAALRGNGPTEEGWIGFEGPRLVAEAIRSGLEIEAILVSASGERHMRAALGPEPGKDKNAAWRIFRASDRIFQSVSGTESPQGIAALARPREWSFDDLLRGDVPLIAVFAGIQDPGNVGTLLRSAEAFGATGAVATRGTAHPFSPKALRASAGSAFRIPLLAGMAPPIVVAQLRMAGLKILGAVPTQGKRPAGESDCRELLRGPCAIFIGNEGAGLPPELMNSADGLLDVPMCGGVESLNAAVAGSVLLYEAARRRIER